MLWRWRCGWSWARRVEIREYHKATHCDHRSRLRRCREPLLGQCQYCARGFCARHGHVLDDGQEVCVEDRCRRLQADVEQHLVFKAAAKALNQDERCGEPECDEAPVLRCDRCSCRYCGEHIRQVIMTVPRGGEMQTEAVAMCDHCRARLPLWAEE